MKKEYRTPNVRISHFQRENILTDSSKPDAHNALADSKNVNAKNITVYDIKLTF